MIIHTSAVYLFFEDADTGNIEVQEVSDFACHGGPVNSHTEEPYVSFGWSPDPKSTSPSKEPMWMVFLDEKGHKCTQPWQDAEVGPVVDEDSGELIDFLGWTESE